MQNVQNVPRSGAETKNNFLLYNIIIVLYIADVIGPIQRDSNNDIYEWLSEFIYITVLASAAVNVFRRFLCGITQFLCGISMVVFKKSRR